MFWKREGSGVRRIDHPNTGDGPKRGLFPGLSKEWVQQTHEGKHQVDPSSDSTEVLSSTHNWLAGVGWSRNKINEDIATKAAGSSSNAKGFLTAEPTSPLSPSSSPSSSNTSGTRAALTRTPSQNYEMLLKSNKRFVDRGSDCVPLRCLFDSVGLCLTKKSWTRTCRHRQ